MLSLGGLFNINSFPCVSWVLVVPHNTHFPCLTESYCSKANFLFILQSVSLEKRSWFPCFVCDGIVVVRSSWLCSFTIPFMTALPASSTNATTIIIITAPHHSFLPQPMSGNPLQPSALHQGVLSLSPPLPQLQGIVSVAVIATYHHIHYCRSDNCFTIVRVTTIIITTTTTVTAPAETTAITITTILLPLPQPQSATILIVSCSSCSKLDVLDYAETCSQTHRHNIQKKGMPRARR